MSTGLTSKFDSLLAHIIRCREVFYAAHQHLQPQAFDGDFLYSHRIIWAAARELYTGHDSMPVENILLADTTNRVDQAGIQDQNLLAAIKNDIIRLIQAIFALPDNQFVPSFALQHMQQVIYEASVMPHASKLSASDNYQEFNRTFDELQSAYTAHQITVPKPVDIFDEQSLNNLRQIRTPTGVGYFDYLLGGGVVEGDAYGLIGGSGGGKTMSAVQMSCSVANNQRHVNFFSYEQQVEGDITRRFHSCGAHIDKEILEKTPRSDWPSDISAKIDEFKDSTQKYLHVYDMSGKYRMGFGGVDELEPVLRSDQERGYAPLINVVDWTNVAIKRYMNTHDLKKDVQLRDEVQRFVDRCKGMAAKYGGSWLLLNQLAPGELGSPGKLPKWSESAEAKNFAWLLDVVFTLGVADKKNRLTIGADKNRGFSRNSLVVQMDPMHACLVAKDGMIWSPSAKEFVAGDFDSEVVPEEAVEAAPKRGQRFAGL